MDDDYRKAKVVCGWSWEENKLFELALAVVDEQHPDRWQVVAAMVGGKKSAEDVQKHYVILLEDLQVIESGQLDHKLQGLGDAYNYLQLDSIQSVCWTDEDNEYVYISIYYYFLFSSLLLLLLLLPLLCCAVSYVRMIANLITYELCLRIHVCTQTHHQILPGFFHL